ncbi:MAG: molecular chaperone DnaJ [Thermoleophilia bacterium]|nr:molecular chaperone DnaJ [Thermoleophilia bacterium]
MPTTRDYYDVLGLDRGASESDLKAAFRRRARELHPDVNPDDPTAEDRFKEVAEAYEVLSDPDQRARYDRFGHAGVRGASGGGPGAQGFGSFQDIFDAFFSGAAGGGDMFGGASSPAAGDDVIVATTVTFVESALGVDKDVEVARVEVCTTCDGTGATPGSQTHTCRQCEGQGQVRQVLNGPLGQFVRARPCPSCSGSGRDITDPCRVCRAHGRVRARSSQSVRIPAGIATGQRVRMSGRGGAGGRGAPAGDLYVEVRVTHDERFVRDDLDIVHEVVIPVTAAMTGTTVFVPTVEGEAEVEIRPGAQAGEEIRIKGMGFPVVHGRERGDQVVTVVVHVPRITSDDGREALRPLTEYLSESGDDGDDEGFFGRLRHAFR